MLKLYRLMEMVPKNIEFIKDNRWYFRKYTKGMLDSRVNNVLRYTDGAKFVDEYSFIDKYGVTVPWMGLSTGGMTILNILYNPDKCFNLIECGLNAFYDLIYIKDGVAAPFMFFNYQDWMDDECLVQIDGRDDSIFTSVKELLV